MTDGHDPNRDGPDDSHPSGTLRSAPDVSFPPMDAFAAPAPSDPTPVQANPIAPPPAPAFLPRPSGPPQPAAVAHVPSVPSVPSMQSVPAVPVPPPAPPVVAPPQVTQASAKSNRKGLGESSGQSAARYASARPHSVPPPREMPVDMPAVILDSSVMNEAKELPPTNQPPSYILSPDAIRQMGGGGGRTQDQIQTMPGGANPMVAAAQAQAKAAAAEAAAHQWRDRARPPTIVMRPRSATTGQKVLTFIGVFVAILLVGALGFIVLETQNLLPGR